MPRGLVYNLQDLYKLPALYTTTYITYTLLYIISTNYINYSIELQLIKHSVEKWDDFNMDLYVYVFRRYLETFKILQKKTYCWVGDITKNVHNRTT